MFNIWGDRNYMLNRFSTNSIQGKDLYAVTKPAHDEPKEINDVRAKQKIPKLKNVYSKMQQDSDIAFDIKLNEYVTEQKEEYILQTMKLMEKKIALRNRKVPVTVIDHLQRDNGDAARKLDIMREKLISQVPPRDNPPESSKNMFVPKNKSHNDLQKIFNEKDYILNRLSTRTSYGKDIYANLHQVQDDDNYMGAPNSRLNDEDREDFFKQYCQAPPNIRVLSSDLDREARLSNVHMYNLEMKLKKLSNNCKSSSFKKLAKLIEQKHPGYVGTEDDDDIEEEEDEEEKEEEEAEEKSYKNTEYRSKNIKSTIESVPTKNKTKGVQDAAPILRPVLYMRKSKISQVRKKQGKQEKPEKQKKPVNVNKREPQTERSGHVKSERGDKKLQAKRSLMTEQFQKTLPEVQVKIQTKSNEYLIDGTEIFPCEKNASKTKRSGSKKVNKPNMDGVLDDDSPILNYKSELLNKYLVTQRGEGEKVQIPTFSKANSGKSASPQSRTFNEKNHIKNNANNNILKNFKDSAACNGCCPKLRKHKKRDKLNYSCNNSSKDSDDFTISTNYPTYSTSTGETSFDEQNSATRETVKSKQRVKRKKTDKTVEFETLSDSKILKREANAIREFKAHRLSSLPEMDVKSPSGEEVSKANSKSSVQGHYEIKAILDLKTDNPTHPTANHPSSERDPIHSTIQKNNANFTDDADNTWQKKTNKKLTKKKAKDHSSASFKTIDLAKSNEETSKNILAATTATTAAVTFAKSNDAKDALLTNISDSKSAAPSETSNESLSSDNTKTDKTAQSSGISATSKISSSIATNTVKSDTLSQTLSEVASHETTAVTSTALSVTMSESAATETKSAVTANTSKSADFTVTSGVKSTTMTGSVSAVTTSGNTFPATSGADSDKTSIVASSKASDFSEITNSANEIETTSEAEKSSLTISKTTSANVTAVTSEATSTDATKATSADVSRVTSTEISKVTSNELTKTSITDLINTVSGDVTKTTSGEVTIATSADLTRITSNETSRASSTDATTLTTAPDASEANPTITLKSASSFVIAKTSLTETENADASRLSKNIEKTDKKKNKKPRRRATTRRMRKVSFSNKSSKTNDGTFSLSDNTISQISSFSNVKSFSEMGNDEMETNSSQMSSHSGELLSHHNADFEKDISAENMDSKTSNIDANASIAVQDVADAKDIKEENVGETDEIEKQKDPSLKKFSSILYEDDVVTQSVAENSSMVAVASQPSDKDEKKMKKKSKKKLSMFKKLLTSNFWSTQNIKKPAKQKKTLTNVTKKARPSVSLSRNE